MNELVPLARKVGVSERTLRRAFEEGGLRGERVSPRRLKLSAAEKDYVLRRWALLARLREALRTEPNVRFALLFGSAARGEDGEGADVDLLVEPRDSSLVRLADLGLKLEALLGREVDLVTLEDAEEKPLLLAEALEQGRVIVDRDQRWRELRPRVAELRARARDDARRRRRRALAGVEELLSS